MDFNQIDLTPMFPGWGMVWQGGSADAAVATLPGPLLIVCMNLGEVDEQFIQHGKSVEAVLAVWIDDSPLAVLDTKILLALVKQVAAWLSCGFNVYVHCAAGVSRASYFDIALHMYALKIDYQAAYTIVHMQRPVINPNSGFAGQLQANQLEFMK